MSFLGLVSPVQQVLAPAKVQIENTVFWLTYRVTLAVFVFFGFLSTGNTFFVNPIHCIQSIGKKTNLDTINNYCWVMGTYHLDWSRDNQFDAGVGIVHPNKINKVYHVYYQWVPFAIFFQMLLFLLPRFLWKKLEGGRMRALVSEMKNQVEGEELEKRVDMLFKSYKEENHENYFYFYKFVFCEILNFLNILLQFILTDKFLGGMFRFYGFKYVNYYMNYQGDLINDPSNLVFPKIANCDFSMYSRGGNMIDADVICLLPLNMMNEKIYFLMWTWLCILLLLNILNLLNRVLTVSISKIPNIPNCSLSFNSVKYSRKCTKEKYRLFMDKVPPQDVFILQLFSNNVDKKTFSNLLARIVANPEDCQEALMAIPSFGSFAIKDEILVSTQMEEEKRASEKENGNLDTSKKNVGIIDDSTVCIV